MKVRGQGNKKNLLNLNFQEKKVKGEGVVELTPLPTQTQPLLRSSVYDYVEKTVEVTGLND